MIEAATVDHGLRPQSADEAKRVGEICSGIGVPHTILAVDLGEAPHANLQARAREARYRALDRWAIEVGLAAVATAHHSEDQAETVLMRLARGTGVGGLVGIQPSRPLGDGDVLLIRPFLDWRRSELREIVDQAGFQPVDDPANADQRFDRSRARALLAATDWLEPHRLAGSAAHCRDAEEALGWIAGRESAERFRSEGDALTINPQGLPRELQRRLLLIAIDRLTGKTPPGPQLNDALAALQSGATTTLAGLKIEGGTPWRLTPAPPRRS
jgi:tRNA(Ile)-lysidine synthase